MKLLIADDNATNLRLLRAQLEAEGHEVVDARNGVEALDLLRAQRFDGVISDILMPEMDGYRLCLEVRKDADLLALPFVLYTSTYNSPADRALALKVGADAYITKPAPTASILDALRAAPGRKDRPQLPQGQSPADADVLKNYSEALVRKLEDKNLELEKSLERLGMVHEIDQAIIAAKTPAQIAEAVLPRLRDLLRLPRVVVNVFDLEKQEAEWLAAVGRQRSHVGSGIRYPLDIMGDLASLKRGEIQTVDVAALGDRPEAKALLESDVRWFMVAPMIVGEELIGGLSFGGPSREFPADTIDIARQAAAQLAIAIHQQRLDDRARQADARYRLLFENVPVGIAMTSVDGRLLSANPAFAHNLGYASVEEALADLGHSAKGLYADAGSREEYLRILRRDGIVANYETRHRRKDGSTIWVSMSGRPMEELRDGDSTLVTMILNISQRKLQEHRIARLMRVKDMQSSISSAVIRIRERQALIDELCRIAVHQGGLRGAWVGWHDRKAKLLRPIAYGGDLGEFFKKVIFPTDVQPGAVPGIAVSVLLGGASQVTNEISSSDSVRHRQEALDQGFLSSMHLPITIDGATEGVLILYASEVGFFDDEERHLLDELAADVSFALDAMQKAERLDYLAYYDPLTGLPNRSLFQDRLAHSLHSRGGDARLIAVVLVDIERFARVNETLGRQSGDQLLTEVGGRLANMNDTVARVGANMFGLVLRGARSAAEVSRALEAIIAACFSEPFKVDGEDLRVSCRSGVALHPDDGVDAEALMRNAEAALRRSRGSGERIVFYAPEMNARVADAMAIENKLRRAIEHREFVLHYQPKIDLATRRIVGVEALIRWQEPGGKLVPPGHFIPILEETGLIVEVGRWAIEQAFVELRAWAALGLKVPRVAVNVSAIQMQRREFVDQVIDEIARGGNTPEWLELEITESLVMRDVEDSIRKLSIVRGMGVTVAIDDFGTGYSSLSYLGRLPVDSLKIDRSFVSGVATSKDATTLVSTVIALAHGLDLKVVAEGVETPEQATILRLFRCDEAQGFLFSRPVPAASIEALLRADKALPESPA